MRDDLPERSTASAYSASVAVVCKYTNARIVPRVCVLGWCVSTQTRAPRLAFVS